jgi:hypothetical protein
LVNYAGTRTAASSVVSDLKRSNIDINRKNNAHNGDNPARMPFRLEVKGGETKGDFQGQQQYERCAQAKALAINGHEPLVHTLNNASTKCTLPQYLFHRNISHLTDGTDITVRMTRCCCSATQGDTKRFSNKVECTASTQARIASCHMAASALYLKLSHGWRYKPAPVVDYKALYIEQMMPNCN